MMKEPRRHSPTASRDGTPRVHASARVRDCDLGRFTDIGERCVLAECEIGDYSYFERNAEAIYASVGKFCAVAADVRINALDHPMERVSQHKITYRPNEYFVGAKVDAGFRAKRQALKVVIGHDVWIGHGAIIMPGVAIGHGAVVGAGAVVTKSVAAYEIVGGAAAKRIGQRFSDDIIAQLIALSWWDWDHDKLAGAIADMQLLPPEEFIGKWR